MPGAAGDKLELFRELQPCLRAAPVRGYISYTNRPSEARSNDRGQRLLPAEDKCRTCRLVWQGPPGISRSPQFQIGFVWPNYARTFSCVPDLRPFWLAPRSWTDPFSGPSAPGKAWRTAAAPALSLSRSFFRNIAASRHETYNADKFRTHISVLWTC